MGEHEYNVLDCGYTLKETEEYLCSVVKEKYTEEQVRQIFKALKLAFCAHEGQLRCNGDPYIIHPMRVALMLLKFDRDTISKVVIGALLHDTVEKTNIGLTEIEERFGGYVANLVQSVTREHNEGQSPQEKTEAKYQNWLKVISASHWVRMIKACEDLENIICWKSIPESDSGWEKIPRWLEKAEKMSLLLARMTNLEAYDVMRREYEYYVMHEFGDRTAVN